MIRLVNILETIVDKNGNLRDKKEYSHPENEIADVIRTFTYKGYRIIIRLRPPTFLHLGRFDQQFNNVDGMAYIIKKKKDDKNYKSDRKVFMTNISTYNLNEYLKVIDN